mmetsp:Transcript_52592/g.127411  ORF Transcript_52592/g.127411 Transcript_52592/m.127411 type:complete len:288 (-) Transcript_52592:1351-2214(-)
MFLQCRLLQSHRTNSCHDKRFFDIPAKCRFVVRFMLHSQEVNKAIKKTDGRKAEEDVGQSVGPVLLAPTSCLTIETGEYGGDQRPLVPSQRHVTETSRIHRCLRHEFHALIDICIVGIVITIEHITLSISTVIVVKLCTVHIFQIVRYTWLADMEGIKRRVPPIIRVVEAVSTEIVVVVVLATTIATDEEISDDVLDRNRRVTATVFFRAGCIGVQTDTDVTTHDWFDVVINVFTAGRCCVRIDTTLGPGLSCALHEGVLFFRPDTDPFMLEELFHPIVVRFVLEEA